MSPFNQLDTDAHCISQVQICLHRSFDKSTASQKRLKIRVLGNVKSGCSEVIGDVDGLIRGEYRLREEMIYQD